MNTENVQAVAIRLPKIVAGPEEYKGSTPIVVFTEQGLNPAGLKSADGAQEEASLPARPVPKYAIEEVVIVLDRSGSMGDPVLEGVQLEKLRHAHELIARLQGDIFPDANIRVVSFNRRAEIAQNGQKLTLAAALSVIARTIPDGDTDFSPALGSTQGLLSAAAPEARKLVLFFTDGNNFGDKSAAEDLARSIGATNAATYLIGIGADYNLEHLVALAGAFGDAAWEHTPNPDQKRRFGPLLMDFIQDLRAQEFALEIHASGNLAGMFSVTPSIRAAADGVAFVGYHAEGIALCFSRDDSPTLQLAVKSHRADNTGQLQDIPILDAEAAAAHFEKLGVARASIAPVLILVAQLNKDREALRNLAQEYPQHAETIAQIFGCLDETSPDAGMLSRSMASDLGTSMSGSVRRRVPVNPLSAVSMRGGRPNANLHSGGVGPLDASAPNFIPPVGRPDPRAYDDAKARPQRDRTPSRVRISCEGVEQDFSLSRIALGKSVILGRSWPADIKVNDLSLARRQLRIYPSLGEFVVENLKPHVPCYRNGAFVSKPFSVRQGTEVVVGKTKIVFY
ncbi:MAG: VWA domain-containing protein [Oligoflexia bacterium]|nr:VWA domain-containing protein [Oligoflexia bacterium]